MPGHLRERAGPRPRTRARLRWRATGFGSTAVARCRSSTARATSCCQGSASAASGGSRAGRCAGRATSGPSTRYARQTAANASGDHAVLVDPCRKRGCKQGLAGGLRAPRRRGRLPPPDRGRPARPRVRVGPGDRRARAHPRGLGPRRQGVRSLDLRRAAASGGLQLLGYERTPGRLLGDASRPTGARRSPGRRSASTRAMRPPGWRARVSIAARNGKFPGGRVIERVAGDRHRALRARIAGWSCASMRGGGGLVAWTGAEGERFVVRAARSRERGSRTRR